MSMILSWALFPLVLAAVGLGWGALVEWAGGGRELGALTVGGTFLILWRRLRVNAFGIEAGDALGQCPHATRSGVSGSRACTAKPPPAAAPAWMSPPCRPVRSSMPAMPCPCEAPL